MFQVLLCDDEPSVTTFLEKEIPWESIGIQRIFIAANGLEALSLFEKNPIDLLITDIRMPRMDGLELLEKVREKYPDTHCILLTAYGEFEYAKAAFRLGVDNYLLKPIQTSELVATVENTVENMYLHRKNQEALFRENLLRRWLSGNISEDELGERANLLDDINLWQSSYCAVCMSKTEHAVSFHAFYESVKPALSPDCDCLGVWDNQGHYVLIIGGHSIDRAQLLETLKSTAQKLGAAGKICVAIGQVVDQSVALSSSYQGGIRLLQSLSPNDAELFALVPQNDTRPAGQDISLDYDHLTPIVQKAVDYIHNEYASGVSIKEFCAGHTITTAYLGYLFKKETDIFFNSYLNAYRLEKAIELLVGSHERVSTIAERCGFASTSYFTTSFRKYTGMSPQKYREQYQ